MSDEPPSRRTVRHFCKYHGLTRNQFLTARDKANIRPKDYDSTLSANDEKALLRYLSVERKADQRIRQIREQPRVTKQFVAPPKPTIDYEAEISRVADSLAKWRETLIELAEGHIAQDRNGRCKRCHAEAPCPTKRTLARLDNDLVEQMAVADSGDLAEGYAADQPMPDVDPERQLSQLYDARNRWRTALTELTIDHMIQDGKGRCDHCPVGAPCDLGKAVTRINRGIARQIEKFACMSDGERDLALGNRRRNDYYRDHDEDDDWDAM